METLVDLKSKQIFFELTSWQNDGELLSAAKRCIEFQKGAGLHMLEDYYKPNPKASDEVSEESLKRLMTTGSAVSDIRSDRSISNCIVFNSRNIEGALQN